MTETEFQDYIKPELLILIPVLYTIGIFLKKSKAIKDKNIPLTLGIISIILCTIYTISTTPTSILSTIFTATTQGILTAGAAVYCNQLIKQSKRDN